MKNALLISLLCLFSTLALAQQTYYRWTDAQGSTHYTRTPPPDSGSTSLEVDSGETHQVASPQASTTDGKDADSDQAAGKEDQAVDNYVKNHKSHCDKYREDLAKLNSGKPLVVGSADEKQQLLSDQRRATMKKRLNKLLSTCNAK